MLHHNVQKCDFSRRVTTLPEILDRFWGLFLFTWACRNGRDFCSLINHRRSWRITWIVRRKSRCCPKDDDQLKNNQRNVLQTDNGEYNPRDIGPVNRSRLVSNITDQSGQSKRDNDCNLPSPNSQRKHKINSLKLRRVFSINLSKFCPEHETFWCNAGTS